MDKIIIIDDRGIQQELQDFLQANKNHIRLSSDMEEYSLSKNHLLKEIIRQYEEKHKVKIRSKDKIRFFKANDIIRFQAIPGETKIFLADGSQNIIKEDMDVIEKQLQDFPFLRIHPKHIVNLHFLAKISKQGGNEIELTNGIHVPVTDRSKTLIIEFLNKYYK